MQFKIHGFLTDAVSLKPDSSLGIESLPVGSPVKVTGAFASGDGLISSFWDQIDKVGKFNEDREDHGEFYTEKNA